MLEAAACCVRECEKSAMISFDLFKDNNLNMSETTRVAIINILLLRQLGCLCSQFQEITHISEKKGRVPTQIQPQAAPRDITRRETGKQTRVETQTRNILNSLAWMKKEDRGAIRRKDTCLEGDEYSFSIY